MEKVMFETVIERLDRLEKMVAEMNQQFSRLPGELIHEPPGNCKTGDEVMAYYGQSKERNAEIIQSMFAKMGISGEPILLKNCRPAWYGKAFGQKITNLAGLLLRNARSRYVLFLF